MYTDLSDSFNNWSLTTYDYKPGDFKNWLVGIQKSKIEYSFWRGRKFLVVHGGSSNYMSLNEIIKKTHDHINNAEIKSLDVTRSSYLNNSISFYQKKLDEIKLFESFEKIILAKNQESKKVEKDLLFSFSLRDKLIYLFLCFKRSMFLTRYNRQQILCSVKETLAQQKMKYENDLNLRIRILENEISELDKEIKNSSSSNPKSDSLTSSTDKKLPNLRSQIQQKQIEQSNFKRILGNLVGEQDPFEGLEIEELKRLPTNEKLTSFLSTIEKGKTGPALFGLSDCYTPDELKDVTKQIWLLLHPDKNRGCEELAHHLFSIATAHLDQCLLPPVVTISSK